MTNINRYKNYLAEILSASWKAVTGTIKTQLILALITFVVLCVGFNILDIKLWGLKSFFIALVDVAPLLGCSIIMLPWAIVHLALGHQELALGLLVINIIIFIARQVLEPLINGKNIGVNPLYTLLSTVICTILFGPWGLLLGSVAAIIIKTVINIRQREKPQ